MTSFKTILVPTDFSASAEAALDHALALAAKFDGKIVLLHAYQIPTVGLPSGGLGLEAELGRRILEGAQGGLDAILEGRKGAGAPLRAVVEQGDSWRVILDVAQREKADLIVMGTHGRRALAHALIGSVAEKVVRTSSVPVLTVRANQP